MDVRAPVRRWKNAGKPQRSELYLRWSLSFMALLQLLVVLLALVGAVGNGLSGTVLALLLALCCVVTWLSARAFGAAVDHYLGRPSDIDRRLTVLAVAALAAVWAGVLLCMRADGTPGADPTSLAAVVAASLLILWFGPVSVARPPRSVVVQGLLGLALLAPPLLLSGGGLATTLGVLTGLSLILPLLGASCRSFAWLLGVVWELDAAREAQSRLAVAEERLRFSRDLHDVMGRNLTTIALKSELAVQLARRGRPEAADQMTEVQRIAQESHREVRDLVRGYRTADLNSEVIGARAVLRAAGVECEIDLGEDAGALSGPVQSVLGWVLREATTNVLRHSEAGHCHVRLRVTGGRAVLELENDGVRSPSAAPPAPGNGTGLHGLRERLAAHGGELALPTVAPGSFLLRAAVPLATDPTALESSPR